jgi:hypothetical protein
VRCWGDRDFKFVRLCSCSAALLTVQNRLRYGFAQFELCADFLECGGESFDLLLQVRVSRYKPSNSHFLFLVFLQCSLRNSLSNIAFTAS